MKKKRPYTKPFLTDVKSLRDRARKNIGEGGVSFTYKGNVDKAIEILQTVLATEIVCVLRYTMHAIAATGDHTTDCSGDHAVMANRVRPWLEEPRTSAALRARESDWEASQPIPSGTAARAAAKVRMYGCNLALQAIKS